MKGPGGARGVGGDGGSSPTMRQGGYPSVDGADDMIRRTAEAMRMVEEQAFHMNHAMDGGKEEESLEAAQRMIKELRVGNLSPKAYYELWMKVFDHLRQLHQYFLDLNGKGRSLTDLYQKVQTSGFIVPRLYMMITVGSALIIAGQAPTQDVLQDLIEMSKGIQHPLRGLFLRNYLLKMTQDKLTKEHETSLDFCVGYILQNLTEMNRLWVRMQQHGNQKNKAKREKERQELKVLISFNLVRLSELEGMSLASYQSLVLPKVLDLVIKCKDRIAQQFLLDVVVQVFPASYHLETLKTLFESFDQLEEGVDIKAILVSLMERIKMDNQADEDEEEQNGHGTEDSTSQAGGEAGQDKKKNKVTSETFLAIQECVGSLVVKQPSLRPEEVLDLYVVLLDFAVSCFPGDLAHIDSILGFSAEYLDKRSSGVGSEAEAELAAQQAGSSGVDLVVVQLLKVPLRQKELGSIDLLGLGHFPALMGKLSWGSKKKVAHSFLTHCLNDKALVLDNSESVTRLLTFIAPLIKDDDNNSDAARADTEEDSSKLSAAEKAVFDDQQVAVAKLVHRFDHADHAELFGILGVARKHFGKGGVKRIRFTLVPLCLRYMQLVNRMVNAPPSGSDKDGVSFRKVFQYIHEICSALAGVVAFQETAMRLFLEAAASADRAKESEIAYEFYVQAFTLYEDIADSKEQLRTLPLLIGTLQTATSFDKEGYETLATKTTQYAARLLKKPDQCNMVMLCSHLFWHSSPQRALRDGESEPAAGADAKRALECLQKSLKIADSCMASSQHVALFVDILNRYVHFFTSGMDKITTQNITDLVQLINGNLSETPQGTPDFASVETFLKNTVKHLEHLKKAHASDPRYAALAL